MSISEFFKDIFNGGDVVPQEMFEAVLVERNELKNELDAINEEPKFLQSELLAFLDKEIRQWKSMDNDRMDKEIREEARISIRALERVRRELA